MENTRYIKKQDKLEEQMKLFKFFGSVNKEMKLVVWPTFKENKRDTWTVIATSLMYAIFFAIVDWGLIKLLQTFIMGK